MRTSFFLSVAALVCCSLSGALIGQTPARASYLIAGNVRGLVLFDGYERRLSAVDQAKLASHSPMRIIDPVSLMGDGLSKIMVVDIDRKRHAIQLDDQARVLIASGTNDTRIVRDAIVLEDTARVAVASGVRMVLPGGDTRRLQKGTIVKRYFKSNERVFVGTVGDPRQFGWLTGSSPGTLEPIVSDGRKSIGTDIRGIMLEKVRRRLEAVNGYLQRLYRTLGVKTGRVVDAPAWKMEEGSGVIVCTLEGASGPDTHPESTRMLADEIRSFALGTDADVLSRPGVIEIRPRE